MQGMLSSIPVYAVMVEDLGERGAHYMAYKEFCREITPAFSSFRGKGSIRDSNDTEESTDDFQFSDGENEAQSFSSPMQVSTALAITGMTACLLTAFFLGGIAARGRR